MRSIVITDYGVTAAGYGGEPTIRLSWDLPLTTAIEVCADPMQTETITLADLKAYLAQREIDSARLAHRAEN